MLGAAALAGLGALIFATSFLAGIFGMAGGMILMGVLIYILPVPAAMVLHGVTQLAANGWRVVLWRRYIDFAIVLRFAVGAVAALALFSFILFVPDRATVLILLGLSPFLAFAVPDRHAPHIGRRGAAEFCGFMATSFQLLSGVSGPLLDSFFVRMPVDRRVIVASKAACQVVSHTLKTIYFGGIVVAVDNSVAAPLLIVGVTFAIIGTTLARSVLDRLTDQQFRRWTRRIVLGIGAVYLVQGAMLLLP